MYLPENTVFIKVQRLLLVTILFYSVHSLSDLGVDNRDKTLYLSVLFYIMI